MMGRVGGVGEGEVPNYLIYCCCKMNEENDK